MMNNLNLQMELLEDVAAPGDAKDFVEGVAIGIGIVAAGAAIIAFT
jgi:hypothetical protein